MRGPDACTLFLPREGGYTAVVLHGVHWQEEIAGSGGVGAAGAPAPHRLVRVYAPANAPLPAELPGLAGSCYLSKGRHGTTADADALTLMAAAKHETGSPAFHHWELLAQ